MNLIDAALSVQTIAGILIIGSLVMSVRSVLMFTRQASEMAPKLQKIEISLAKLQDGMGEKRKTVKELTTVVEPLRARESKLRIYFEELKNLELKHEREEHDKEEKDEAEKRKRIQRKKMGFD